MNTYSLELMHEWSKSEKANYNHEYYQRNKEYWKRWYRDGKGGVKKIETAAADANRKEAAIGRLESSMPSFVGANGPMKPNDTFGNRILSDRKRRMDALAGDVAMIRGTAEAMNNRGRAPYATSHEVAGDIVRNMRQAEQTKAKKQNQVSALNASYNLAKSKGAEKVNKLKAFKKEVINSGINFIDNWMKGR